MSYNARAAAMRLLDAAIENIDDTLIDSEADWASLSEEDHDRVSDLLDELVGSQELHQALDQVDARVEREERDGD